MPGGNDRTLVDAYATGPWNCCLSYTVPDLAYLDYLSGKGLKVIHGLHNHELTPEGDAACRAAVLAHRDHPAVIGWYLFDEMPVSRIREMAARNRLVRESDPDHPTYAVFDKVASIRDYLPARTSSAPIRTRSRTSPFRWSRTMCGR